MSRSAIARSGRTIGRVRLLLLAVFTLGAIGVGYYQLAYAQPKAACVAKGRWWHAQTRSCGTPVFIPDFTNRPAPAGVERPRFGPPR